MENWHIKEHIIIIYEGRPVPQCVRHPVARYWPFDKVSSWLPSTNRERRVSLWLFQTYSHGLLNLFYAPSILVCRLILSVSSFQTYSHGLLNLLCPVDTVVALVYGRFRLSLMAYLIFYALSTLLLCRL